MQAVYTAYYPTATGTKKKGAEKLHSLKQKDYLLRSEKRSPYDDADNPPPDRGNGGDDRDPWAGILYILCTLVLLIALYPVGLFFLWARRLHWSVGTKLLLTVITALLFCVLVVFAINYDTGNPRIKGMQESARSGLEKVNEYTGDSVDTAVGWCETQYETGAQNAAAIWDAVKPHVAEKTLELYGRVEGNIAAMKVELPTALLNEYKRLIDYREPVKAEKELVKQATPDTGVSATMTPTATPVATPTPEPTSTPTPTPTPVPIILPEIKDAGLAPVYFTPNGTYYHAAERCSGMLNAVSHTLSEAKEAGKQVCEACGVTPLSMADSVYYLWVDDKNVAHTSDECPNFAEGRYNLLPFEDVYAGSYTYCATCGGNTCLEYIRQHEAQFAVSYDELDEITRRLYEYEKTVTVYYGENSRKYHANKDCMHMEDEKYVHTLYQALHIDRKQRCELCLPLTEEDALTEVGLAATKGEATGANS